MSERWIVGERVRLLAYGDEVIERIVVGESDNGRPLISTEAEIERARAAGRKPLALAWPLTDVLDSRARP